MEVGREMDAMVAEKVMGLEIHQARVGDMIFTVHRDFVDAGDYWHYQEGHGSDCVPSYSTDIAAAWQVVDWAHKYGNITIQILPYATWVEVNIVDPVVKDGDQLIDACKDFLSSGVVSAKTTEHAICLAALKAVGALE